VETLKQRVTCIAARLRKYKNRLLRRWQNSLFCRNERAFYANLKKETCEKLSPPNLDDLKTFWQGIFERTSEANLQATWLSDLRDRVPLDGELVSETPNIDVKCFTHC